MSVPDGLLDESAEDLFENAPCGYLTTALDGTILRVNRTFEELIGPPARGARREPALPGPADRRRADLPRDALRAAAADAGLGARDRGRDRARRRQPPAGARQLRPAPRRRRRAARDPHDGLRRDRPPPLRAGAARARAGASRTSRSSCSAACSPARCRAARASSSASPTARRSRGSRSAATGTTRSGSSPGERVGLVVGDVVGRGLGAAATMGQLRSAVRALASTGLRAGRAARGAVGVLAPPRGRARWRPSPTPRSTCGCGTMRYACAGHPPPAIVEPGGAAGVRVGGALAAARRPHRRGATGRRARCSSRPARTVVLYTDGLIERSDRPLQPGLDQLLATVDGVRDLPPAAIATRSRARSPTRLRGRTTSACSRCGSAPAPRVCSSHWRDGRTARLPVVPAGVPGELGRRASGHPVAGPAGPRLQLGQRGLKGAAGVLSLHEAFEPSGHRRSFPVRAPPRTLSTWPRSDSFTLLGGLPGANV